MRQAKLPLLHLGVKLSALGTRLLVLGLEHPVWTQLGLCRHSAWRPSLAVGC
jgi:hypothetical protein